ncbi:tetratricopeptide repeat protein [Rhodobacter aestuarii]|uniref:Tetratricopeptide repeat-containing protein n=1 Tax=Rhodobacter aestuarii TaxID=453582 RepID=A0A1N7N6A8_9RHOB|nr:tetratricopeptide repeat protein [Rhodobacter aestuarii]PTV96253.1 tetratricopeptide repeat protein [Rhodobacter aestuarii]SIS93699.1 Tetratricopeptide repeat-containing protein [Rhodobacter aestuarii]
MPFAKTLSRALYLLPTLACLAALPTFAREDGGAYLAGRAALLDNDFAQAAPYYDRLLLTLPDDQKVQEGALFAHVALGEVEKARDISKAIASGDGAPTQVAVLVLLADAAMSDDFAAGTALLEGGADAGQLVGGLYKAWALVGQGQMSEAMQAFDAIAKIDGLEGFAGYHRALALALVGDYEGAEEIFSGAHANIYNGTRRGVLAHVEILSQLERNEDAIALLDASFGAPLDDILTDIRDRLEAGETLPFTAIGSAREGVAELFYSVAQALNADSIPGFALLHARLALWLRPDHTDAALLTAAILEQVQQYDLAISAYAMIGTDSPAFHAAEMGRAEAMVEAGRSDAAIEVLEQLTRTHADLPGVWVALGDNLRREDRFAEAAKAYDKAIELSGEPKRSEWGLWYARAIAQERSGQWEQAEAGFRKALELNPGQPAVLNYLGYSYVEKRQNLDEALDMIQRAVAGRPDDGYITDSLGWAYYRLGRYTEAAEQMERAVELMPQDALLNDHLGDVYWAVGRKREAEFQWRRALNFGPAPDLDLDRVRRKLEVGLDVVLKEEGAAPLHSDK